MFQLARKLRQTEPVFCLWQTVAAPSISIAASKAGLTSIVMDVQHGEFSLHDVFNSVPVLHGAGIGSAVRIAAHDYAFAARAVDAGVEAIIAPLINTRLDAEKLVEAIKYPPVGGRSWGPSWAMYHSGNEDPQEHLRNANNDVLAFAMIETVEGLQNIDEILAVEGLDGLLVGPSDLSIALSNGASLDAFGETSLPVIQSIAEKTLEADKIPACFTGMPEHTQQAVDFGFRFISISTDTSLFTNAVANRMSTFASSVY